MEAARDMALRAPALTPVLAAIGGFAGSGLGIIGTPAGGALVRRISSRRAGGWAIGAQSISVAALALTALGFVAVYAELLGYASPRQAGVDVTRFQGADALVALVGGITSGALSARLDYSACFGLAAVVALAAVPATEHLVRHAPR